MLFKYHLFVFVKLQVHTYLSGFQVPADSQGSCSLLCRPLQGLEEEEEEGEEEEEEPRKTPLQGHLRFVQLQVLPGQGLKKKDKK